MLDDALVVSGSELGFTQVDPVLSVGDLVREEFAINDVLDKPFVGIDMVGELGEAGFVKGVLENGDRFISWVC